MTPPPARAKGSELTKARMQEYRAKRDFTITPEPDAGLGEIVSSPHLRFVIQKHAARRLHYDLRLEIGGAFNSWAVTRGPSLDPGQKRLAVAVEDHPLAYGDFEGTIPEGQYGGGTVMIWDRGFWAPETDEPIAQSLRNGELKFALAGHKLRGSFVLVRLKVRPNEHRENWLLIKHRDEWATPGTDTVLSDDRSVASGRTMSQIKAGSGASPTPFVTAGRKLTASAVWTSNPQGDSMPAMDIPRLTHPERVLWPGQTPITKLDLAVYLRDVAPWIIEHVAGRPCSLLRAPDGIEGEHFFQRHAMAGQPESLTKVTVDPKQQPYIQIDDAETLVALAQFSVCEFHPWNSARGAPGVPGRLVFDLDPAPNVPFDTVVDAARLVRDRLRKLGLTAFCKTTGGKGLHVVTPLVPDEGLAWEQAKLFAQTIARQLAEEFPDRFVATMTKSKRAGRIFIGYLRNDVMATAVAPLSPRARPGAPVSMPLGWSQVRRGLDPSRFTVRTAPSLIARSDAWKDYAASAGSLRDAIQRLIGDH